MSAKSDQVKAGKWIEDHLPKLRQYAAALKRRDTGIIFGEGDFLNTMSMKIIMTAGVTGGFIDQPDNYILKAAWNEGLIMLRRQRRYEMTVVVHGSFSTDEDQDLDPLDNVPAPDDDLPENLQLASEQNELIARAIESLPETSRQIVSYLYAGYKPGEIESMMGLKTFHYHIKKVQGVFASFGLQAV